MLVQTGGGVLPASSSCQGCCLTPHTEQHSFLKHVVIQPSKSIRLKLKNPAIVYQSATQTVKPTHPVSEKTRKVAKNTKENEKQIPCTCYRVHIKCQALDWDLVSQSSMITYE